MQHTGELICNSGEFINRTGTTHQVIYNRLDLPHLNNGKEYIYDPDEIRKALPLFQTTHLVFANRHPPNIGKLPLEDALKEVDGRIIGTPQDVLVNNNGTLFFGSVSVVDPEANRLIKEGKARLSSSFEAFPDENGVLLNIIPNHILVYPSDGNPPPGDHAALFLTNQAPPHTGTEKQRDQTMPENETAELAVAKVTITNQAAEIANHKEKVSSLEDKLTESKTLITNQESKISTLEGENSTLKTQLEEKAALITNQESELSTLKEEYIKVQNQLQEIKTNEKKARRLRIFNQYLPGTKKVFDSKKEEMLSYDEDTYADFIFEMNQHQSGIKPAPTDEEGTVNVENQDTEPEATNGVSIEKDPVTGKLVAKVIKRGA